MDIDRELAHMDATTRDAKKQVRTYEALKRLEKHDDFQLIFGQQLMSEDVVATVAKLALPAFQSEQLQASLLHKIRAASEVGYFLQMIETKANEAEQVILKTDADREELILREALGEEE